ncbi:MAG: DsrE family protein, partial [Gammaproteobacteria bacterium]|nr:DsrE family protein [Gammaproteobacteria bacterium]
MMRTLPAALLLVLLPLATGAGEDAFTKGPVLSEYGPNADVEVTYMIPPGSVFRHSFDVSKPAEQDKANRGLQSLARFINMHARAGVETDDLYLAAVIHGKAVKDVSTKKTPTAGLIADLLKHNVRIIVCGQSAAYYDVATADLLPGVEMA